MLASGGTTVTPSLCGTFLTNKRSLIAFTWTITTVLTLVAFVMALVMTIHTHTHYKRMEHYYQEQWEYHHQYNQNNDDGQSNDAGSQDSMDREYEQLIQLGKMKSSSMTFVALYTMALAVALSLYGSTAIVGFTSLHGVYIAPCFSSPTSSKLKVGIFGGAIILFANLLLVCAVIFGEVRVEDWNDHREQQQEDREKYEVERIATILAVTCMFMSALYTIFAILLFLYYGSSDGQSVDEMDMNEDGVVVGGAGGTGTGPGVTTTPHKATTTTRLSSLVPNDPRREGFITMGDT